MQLFKTLKGFTYKKAYISKGKTWYIEFEAYHPDLKRNKRVRKTFAINRTKDLKEREKRAKYICKKINLFLPRDYPFTNNSLELNLDNESQDYNVEIIKLLSDNGIKEGEVIERLATLLLARVGKSVEEVQSPVEATNNEFEKGFINIFKAIEIGYKYRSKTTSFGQ